MKNGHEEHLFIEFFILVATCRFRPSHIGEKKWRSRNKLEHLPKENKQDEWSGSATCSNTYIGTDIKIDAQIYEMASMLQLQNMSKRAGKLLH